MTKDKMETPKSNEWTNNQTEYEEPRQSLYKSRGARRRFKSHLYKGNLHSPSVSSMESSPRIQLLFGFLFYFYFFFGVFVCTHAV